MKRLSLPADDKVTRVVLVASDASEVTKKLLEQMGAWEYYPMEVCERYPKR